MKKRWLLASAMLLVLVLGGIYEMATQVGRGWLRSEAFFEKRPTSYWAARIEAWQQRFAMRQEALDEICPPGIHIVEQLRAYPPPQPHLLDRVQFWLRPHAAAEYYDPPAVLRGGPAAEAVLCELENDASQRPFVERAREAARRDER
jgi:hypothetical protein